MSSSKRLLVVSSTYPAASDDKVPRFVYDQLKAFSELDPELKINVLSPHNRASNYSLCKTESPQNIQEHRFHYFIPRYERLTDRGIMPALTVSKLNYLLIPFFMVAEFFALLKLAIKTKPDVIYAHWFTPQAINAGIVSFITRTPFGYTTHASDVDVWRRFGVLGRKIVQTLSSRSTFITAVSTQTQKKLEAFLDKPLDISVIPMGIYYKAHMEKAKDTNHLLFIGRLTEKKGLHYALIAFKQLIVYFPDAHLTIAGEGEMRGRLEEEVYALGLTEHVEFVGFVSGTEKQALLESADIMIVPSIITKNGDAEGLPVSLMEGLSAGMICIASDASGANDILTHETSGFIVPARDSLAIEQAMKRVLSLSKNSKGEIIREAHRTAKKLDWPSIAKQHLNLINKALDDTRI